MPAFQTVINTKQQPATAGEHKDARSGSPPRRLRGPAHRSARRLLCAFPEWVSFSCFHPRATHWLCLSAFSACPATRCRNSFPPPGVVPPLHHTLNVCVPRKFPCSHLTPTVMTSGGGTFGRLGPESRASCEWDQCLMIETPESPLTPSAL